MIFTNHSHTMGLPTTRIALLSTALAGAALMAPQAQAQTAPASTGTAAGTVITNVAKATYKLPNGDNSPEVSSPAVVIKVSELLVVDVTSLDGANVDTSPGATDTILTFTVTNTGNGVETYDLSTVVPATPTSTVTGLIIDVDNSGDESSGDLPYDPAAGIELQPGQQVQVLVRVTTATGVGDGMTQDIGLVAVSQTLTGGENPGDVLTGEGDNGSDAVVGVGGARDRDDGTVIVRAATLRLVKAAVVAGGQPLPGATVTYTITATAEGSGVVRGIVITDAIPSDTTYTPSSLKRNGTAVTDAADGDKALFANDAIEVEVGNLANGANATVSFDVTID